MPINEAEGVTDDTESWECLPEAHSAALSINSSPSSAGLVKRRAEPFDPSLQEGSCHFWLPDTVVMLHFKADSEY